MTSSKGMYATRFLCDFDKFLLALIFLMKNSIFAVFLLLYQVKFQLKYHFRHEYHHIFDRKFEVVVLFGIFK